MTSHEGQNDAVNWSGVALGAVLLALLVAAITPVFPRVVAAVGVLALTFYLTSVRDKGEVGELPAAQGDSGAAGLDRRKYGRMRVTTGQMLENVRRMNQIAVDARNGKITQRHANGELDRIAAVLRDLITELRKSAGMPTPVVESGPLAGKIISPINETTGGSDSSRSAKSQGDAGSPELPEDLALEAE